MRIVNAADVPELTWSSPKGRFRGAGKQISEALGRVRDSTDLLLRHPFDVEIQRLEPGAVTCPYHLHTVQWEFYSVVSGRGTVRHAEGRSAIGPGDAFLFKPNEAHQLINDGDEDLVLFVVADNPLGEACYYPDSDKWAIETADGPILRSPPVDYYDGEE